MAAEQLAWHAGTGAARRLVTGVLIASLLDPEPEVRFWSAYALAQLRVRRALPYLRGLLGDRSTVDTFWTVGEEAGFAITAIESGRWPPLPGDSDVPHRARFVPEV